MSQLPDDSRLVTWQIDKARDEPRPAKKKRQPLATVRWGQEHHLLADVRDLLQSLQHTMVTIAAGQSNARAPQAPEPLPRPTDQRDGGRAKDMERRYAALDAWAKRNLGKRGDDAAAVDSADEPGLPPAEKDPGPVV